MNEVRDEVFVQAMEPAIDRARPGSAGIVSPTRTCLSRADQRRN